MMLHLRLYVVDIFPFCGVFQVMLTCSQWKYLITQGTTKAQCSVYLWDYHDKVVISDIDGTITRSDVAGQVLPLVGMDWTQNGVVRHRDTICKG